MGQKLTRYATTEKAITLADSPYTASPNFNCIKVNTAGGNVRVNLTVVDYPIDVIKTSSDSYIVTVWVGGVQKATVAGELSKITIENAEVTKDEPWYPYDAIVGIAGVSGDGGEIIAKDRFGRVIAGGRGVAGTDDKVILNAPITAGYKNIFIAPGEYHLAGLPPEGAPGRGCIHVHADNTWIHGAPDTILINDDLADEYTICVNPHPHTDSAPAISGCKISDLTFRFVNNGYGGVWLWWANDCVLENLRFECTGTGSPDEYIFLLNSDYNSISNIQMAGGHHLDLYLSSSNFNHMNRIRSTAGATAIMVGYTSNPSNNNLFNDFVITNMSSIGVWVSENSRENTFSNGQIEDCDYGGITIDAGALMNKFSEIVVKACGSHASEEAVGLINAGVNNEFDLMTILENHGAGLFSHSGTTFVRNSIFRSNSITAHSFQLCLEGGNNIAEHNLLEDKDATPNVDGGITVNGVGNIVRFNKITEGISIFLWDQNVGSNTIKYNVGWPTESSGTSTGTGSEQTIAHGLAAIPTGCKAWKKIEYPVGSGRYITIDIPYDVTYVYPTVDNGVAFEWGIA